MPPSDLLWVFPFGKEIDQFRCKALWHLSVGEDLLKSCEEGLVNLLLEGGEEGSGQPILPWALLPIYVLNCLLHLCHSKWGE